MRSTACWSSDARTMSALDEPRRGWGNCVHLPDPCPTSPTCSLSDPIRWRPCADPGQKRDTGGWIMLKGVDDRRPVTEAFVGEDGAEAYDDREGCREQALEQHGVGHVRAGDGAGDRHAPAI